MALAVRRSKHSARSDPQTLFLFPLFQEAQPDTAEATEQPGTKEGAAEVVVFPTEAVVAGRQHFTYKEWKKMRQINELLKVPTKPTS
jgi:hypothetical protein